jgi:hypothetical protein
MIRRPSTDRTCSGGRAYSRWMRKLRSRATHTHACGRGESPLTASARYGNHSIFLGSPCRGTSRAALRATPPRTPRAVLAVVVRRSRRSRQRRPGLGARHPYRSARDRALRLTFRRSTGLVSGRWAGAIGGYREPAESSSNSRARSDALKGRTTNVWPIFSAGWVAWPPVLVSPGGGRTCD